VPKEKGEAVSEDPPALPPGLDLLWGRRGRGSRGPKPGLTIEAIVGAAIDLADREGLAAVSMARLAKVLGFTTMSLYRYITNKEELLQLMWNASATGAEDFAIEGEGWRERLTSWAMVQREMLDRHPWITQMPMAAPPMGPNSLTFLERGLESLDGTGLDEGDKLRVIGLLSSYTLSEARMAHDALRSAEEAAAMNVEGALPAAQSYEGLLRQLVDEDRFPRLFKIAWADQIGGAPTGFEEREEYLFGLNRILDGVQVLIAHSDSAHE
jgi:AcrR family transcriptional regulator